MTSEVFRFVTIRPPQSRRSSGVLAFDLSGHRSPFTDSVRQHRGPDDRQRLLAIVAAFVGSPVFVGGQGTVPAPVRDYHERLLEASEQDFSSEARRLFAEVFDVDPAVYIADERYATLRGRVGDSIIAAILDASIPSEVRSLLASLAMDLAVVEALAGAKPLAKADFVHTTIVLPQNLLPLPRIGQDLAQHRQAEREAQRRRNEERRSRLERLRSDIAGHRTAIDELLGVVLRRTGEQNSAGAARARVNNGFILTPAEYEGLSSATKAITRAVGLETRIEPVRAIGLIEGKLADLAATLYADTRTTRMVRIGKDVFPIDQLAGVLVDVAPGPDLRSPGPCRPAPLGEPGNDDGVTVPTGHGEARVLGIADLMLVEQKLARYELGEIAHIENVLKSEVRERRFRTKTTTEVSTLTETEETEENEQDLSSAERFELQVETQNVINENSAREAGLTINASYGPTVDATATLKQANTTAKQRSERVSSNFARETTSKAVSRVQKRTFERRFVKTVREIEESNLHSFDNATGTAHISGVYRFVDKIYTAQIVNYGKRLMLEFVAPEPAAFWRYALANRPLEPVTLTPPDPPGYCLADGKTFMPLQARDITPENYMFWASKYDAMDVKPPPTRTQIASLSKKGPESFQTGASSEKISSDVFEIPVPEGYRAVEATVNAYGETQAGTHKLVIQIQDSQFFYVEPTDDQLHINLGLQPTTKVPVSVNSLRFHNYELLISLLCVLTRERLEEWQLATYFSIKKAYEAAKSRYDDAVEAARIRAGYDVSFGRNPAENREIERTELKRACISLMTGQRFEAFDAMNRNVAPHGYPEIDFTEAKAEARFIQLFEQGLEWNNITYVFYSYFWSRKDEWPALAQLSDTDPLFNRFLQAGAARVQVPVRLGFETSILNYLAGFEVWDADGNLLVSEDGEADAGQLSIITELKSQFGNNATPGVGRLRVTQGEALVLGVGTQFTDDDENRRIEIGGATYVIKAVESADRIRLRTPYDGESDSEAPYSLGPQLVGEPWEVRLPTNLVKIDDYAF